MKQFSHSDIFERKELKCIPWVAVQLLKWCIPAEPHSHNRYNSHAQNNHCGQSADPPLQRERDRKKNG